MATPGAVGAGFAKDITGHHTVRKRSITLRAVAALISALSKVTAHVCERRQAVVSAGEVVVTVGFLLIRPELKAPLILYHAREDDLLDLVLVPAEALSASAKKRLGDVC